MPSPHLLNELTPDRCVAILTLVGEIHFLVHPVSATSDAVRRQAEREGAEVLATHMRNPALIQNILVSQERKHYGEINR